MNIFKFLSLLLLSQRGEGEGEGGDGGAGGEGSDAGQGDPNASAGDGQQGAQGGAAASAPTLEQLTAQFAELNSKYETLKNQSGATERNLSAERKALEGMGFRVVRDNEGNVQIMPAKTASKSRFTDEHKSKFMSYFPDQQSGDGFLSLLDLMLQDRIDSGIQGYDKNVQQGRQFESARSQAIDRMFKLFPSLNAESKEFNKAFYDKADQILMERYMDKETGRILIPHADLIAANEAAIELGIAPAAVAAAKKDGFLQGKNSAAKIVGSAQGSQSPAGAGGSGGFRKITKEEYMKLPTEGRAKYDKDELANRGK